MPALIPVPSKLLKFASAVARWLLVLTLSAWILLAAIWGALHWVIVPRIGDFRVLVERQASMALGMPVKIGDITAQSSGLIPSFEFSDVRLFDAQGKDALVLGRVVLAVSPQSALSLSFDQLYIDGPQLDVRRLLDGKFIVAGVVLAGSSSQDDGKVADWLFSQKEVVIRNGVVRWSDERNPQAPLTLSQVDFVLRNGFRQHDLRLDATPDPLLGSRFTLMGKFRQPLWSVQTGYWQDWSGQMFGNFDRVDVAALSRYASPDIKVGRGTGALRAWVDIRKGRAELAVADLALADVSTRIGGQSSALELHSLGGRLGGKLKPDGFEFHSQDLVMQKTLGQAWPGGNFKLEQSGRKFELEIDKLDLALIAQVAEQLPIGEDVRAKLSAINPKGRIDGIRANWMGEIDAPEKFGIKGKVTDLELSSAGPKTPGIRGLTADFDLTESAGRVKVEVIAGAVELPGFLEDPKVPLTDLKADVQWKREAEHIVAQSTNLKFSNSDAQGEGQFKWQTSTPNAALGRGRFPGVLDLQVAMSRFEGASVHRYLPVAILPEVRAYVREAVRKGQASNVKFKIKGDLYDMPFQSAKQGEFSISATVADVNFAFVPPRFAEEGALPWPELTQISGEFLIDRLQLQLKNASGRLAGKSGVTPLQIVKAEGQIPDLLHSPTVMISGDAKGLMSSMLALVNDSPLRLLSAGALSEMTASGQGELKLKLNIPLGAFNRTAIQGNVAFTDSDVQVSAKAPALTQAKGVVNFNERGFQIPNLQARIYGGDVAIQGGSPNFGKADASSSAGSLGKAGVFSGVVLQAKGNLNAEALRQAKDLGLVHKLAQQATGATDYTAALKFGVGGADVSVASNLTGLALALPPPFAKSAESAMPVRIQITNTLEASAAAGRGPPRLTDHVQIDFPKIASIAYVRDLTGDVARVLSGSIAVGLAGDETVLLPAQGVAANINLAVLDLDAWSQVFTQTAGLRAADIAGVATPAPAGGSAPGAAVNPALAYLPTTLAVRAGELSTGGRKFHQVVVGASREASIWRANLESTEFSGYAEYRQPAGGSPGRIYARLARLTLAASSEKEVEALLDEPPANIPALDIMVDDLELRGKKFGRVEIEAINRVAGTAREWRLAKFNVQMPEATFTATGNWATLNAQNRPVTAAPARAGAERRRTVMNFKLDINDSGALLARVGMKDVVRMGKGKLEGQVAWVGSPLALDYPSLGGNVNVNVESGQFLKADPGIAKLLGVLSLQSLPRRLALDFRDVFSEGFSFDFVRGDISIDQGIAVTNNLQMKGVNAAVLMEGRADIAKETQDLRVVVVPEINAGTASLIATVINPAIGLGTFLAQLILRRPLIETATQEFHVDGTWIDPRVVRVNRKTDNAADVKVEPAR